MAKRGTEVVPNKKDGVKNVGAEDRQFVQDVLGACGCAVKVRVGVVTERPVAYKGTASSFVVSGVKKNRFTVGLPVARGKRRYYPLEIVSEGVDVRELADMIKAIKISDIQKMALAQRKRWEEEKAMEKGPSFPNLPTWLDSFLREQFANRGCPGGEYSAKHQALDYMVTGLSQKVMLARVYHAGGITLVVHHEGQRLLVRVDIAMRGDVNMRELASKFEPMLEPPGNPLAGIAGSGVPNDSVRNEFLAVMSKVIRPNDGRYHARDIERLMSVLPQKLRASRIYVASAIRSLEKAGHITGHKSDAGERISSYSLMPVEKDDRVEAESGLDALVGLSDEDLAKMAEPALPHVKALEGIEQLIAKLSIDLEVATEKRDHMIRDVSSEAFAAVNELRERSRVAALRAANLDRILKRNS